MSYQDQGQDPISKVRSFLQSILSKEQLQLLEAILAGVDTETDPPPPTGLQRGGTEGPPPTKGGPMQSAGFDRRKLGRDSPPQFNGMPTTDGRGPRPYGQSHQANYGSRMDAFAGDSIAADRELRRRLRVAGHPLGDHGGPGTALRYANACGLSHLALDSAPPYRAPADVDAGPQAAMRIGALSYAGRIVHEEAPRAPGLAYDQGSNPLSVGNVFPELAARFSLQEMNERRAFAVVNPESKHADERNMARRSRSGGMAMDAANRASAARAPSISDVFGSEMANRLNAIGYVR